MGIIWDLETFFNNYTTTDMVILIANVVIAHILRTRPSSNHFSLVVVVPSPSFPACSAAPPGRILENMLSPSMPGWPAAALPIPPGLGAALEPGQGKKRETLNSEPRRDWRGRGPMGGREGEEREAEGGQGLKKVCSGFVMTSPAPLLCLFINTCCKWDNVSKTWLILQLH